MRTFTAVVERDIDSGMLIGVVPGFPGAHSQARTMEELEKNLVEVIEMLLEDGEPDLYSEIVGTLSVRVPDHAKTASAQAPGDRPNSEANGVR